MMKKCPHCHNLYNFSKQKNCSCKGINQYKRNYYKNNHEEHRFLTSKQWKFKRQEILERDKYHCIRCWYKYNKINIADLQVHHIKSRRDYPELRLDDDNLLTVCKKCNLELGTSNKLDFEMDH